MADIRAVLRVAETAAPNLPKSVDPVHHKRQLVAQLCRLIGERTIGRSTDKTDVEKTKPASTDSLPNLSPRMQQTLERLLAGDSEKQIAHRLGVSRNTVHVYVKALYKGFEVNSRGELLARFVQAPTFEGTDRRNGK